MQSGKRGRRQAAALVVQSLWSSTNSKKNSSSTTTTRPDLVVPPMGFGPIRDPNANDVLCGRGGLINGSPGNVQFRTIVAGKKKEYNAKTTKRHEKAHMAAEIVRHIRSMNPPGRFLREDTNGLWFDVGDARAIRKTGQALREAAPAIRTDGEGGEANPAGKDDDKLSDSGSEGKPTETATKPTEKKGSPKRRKSEASVAPKKETKSKSPERSAKRLSVTEAATAATVAPVPIADAMRNSSSRQRGKRNWLPSMMGGSLRRSTANNNGDEASVSADTIRSSQTYLIPQSALGPHITGASAVPRMSPGAVFSNSHRRGAEQPPYPPPHAHHYPYPYAHHMMPPPYPHLQYPQQHLNNHNPLQPPTAIPVQMFPNARGMPLEEDAFGMNFFPTRDVDMQSSCTISDISGLSSTMAPAGEQRKQHPSKHHAKKPQPDSENGSSPLLQPPTTTSTGQQANMDEASMLDTTSSLPSFTDILDDVDMASANGGGGASSMALSISSSSVAKMMMAPPPPQIPGGNKNKGRGGGASLRGEMKTELRAGDISMKENSNSTGSCLSGKGSEISLPSSCGTALSQFSDSFMALHLSDPHEFE